MGPFAMLGKIFNTAGTTVDAIDKTVTRTTKLLDDTFDMADYAMDDVKADMATDRLVSDAKRKARVAEAKAEADAIIASIKKP